LLLLLLLLLRTKINFRTAAAASFYFVGRIKKILYYPIRIIRDAQISYAHAHGRAIIIHYIVAVHRRHRHSVCLLVVSFNFVTTAVTIKKIMRSVLASVVWRRTSQLCAFCERQFFDFFRNPYRIDIKFTTILYYKRTDRSDDRLFMAINQILSSSAHRALAHEYKSLQDEPVEGFRVKLIEDNLREWEVAIFGPPETLYQGGYFKVPYFCLSYLFCL